MFKIKCSLMFRRGFVIPYVIPVIVTFKWIHTEPKFENKCNTSDITNIVNYTELSCEILRITPHIINYQQYKDHFKSSKIYRIYWNWSGLFAWVTFFCAILSFWDMIDFVFFLWDLSEIWRIIFYFFGRGASSRTSTEGC